MTDDLVKRLLEPVDDPFFGEVVEPIKWEAANEIERLQSIINDDRLEGAADRIEQLEAALSHYACGCKEDKCTPEKPRYRDIKCGWPARQALEGKKND
jgi:hypothetical protein